MSKERGLELEHATLLEHYNATREEINGLLDASRQVVAMTFTLISLFVGVLVFVEEEYARVLLILPLFLNGLAWVQLRYNLLMLSASAHIANVIAPRVRAILHALSDDPQAEFDHILNWEKSTRSHGHRKFGWLLLPVLGSGYGFPLFAAVLSLIAYVAIVSEIKTGDWLLLAINLAALVYSVVLGYWVEFRRLGLD